MLLLLVACRDSLHLEPMGGNNRLVVYAFPAPGDGFDIHVSVSRSLAGRSEQLRMVAMICRNNGVDCPIRQVADTILGEFPTIVYHVSGSFSAGDQVDLHAEAVGMAAVSASTIIPHPTSAILLGSDTICYQGYAYTQMRLMVEGAATLTYYAVRVENRCNDENEQEESGRDYLQLETTLEPLLNHYTDADLNFGAWNDYYHNMYVFDNSSFGQSTATLRLCTIQQSRLKVLQVHLFALSLEYYQMLRSLNDRDNNDVGRYGLSMIFSTYSNVHGGYGCVAGYVAVEPQVEEKR